MDPIIPEKQTGDTFSAIECNSIVQSLYTKVDLNAFSTYAAFKAFAQAIGVTSKVYQCIVIADEKNNNGGLTNYTYQNGKLNWVATTQIAL